MDLDRIANIAAIIIAVIALYVGWDQARIGRAQQHADVLPVLEIRTQLLTQTDDEGTPYRSLSLKTVNLGVGPAFVEKANVQVGDTPLARVADFSQAAPEGLSFDNSYQGNFANYVLGAGEEQTVLEVLWPVNEDSQALINTFMQDFWQMDYQVCFCSIYERCWTTAYLSDTIRPVPVEACPADWESR